MEAFIRRFPRGVRGYERRVMLLNATEEVFIYETSMLKERQILKIALLRNQWIAFVSMKYFV